MKLSARQRILIFAIWTGLGLLETSRTLVRARLQELPISLSEAVIGNLPWWWLWALLTPVCLWLAAQYRLDQARWQWAAVTHLVAGTLLSVVHLLATGWLYYLTVTRGVLGSASEQLQIFVSYYLFADLLTYAAVLAAFYVHEFRRRMRVRELEAAELRVRAADLSASATRARLAALQMELNPHFLFNSLNAVSGLVRSHDREGAIRMLARIGDLLRVTLEHGGDSEVPLERELEYLRRYLDVEQVRLGSRLRVEIQADPAALEALVPPLLLQPLVENGIRYGVAQLPQGGSIVIDARVGGDTLEICVLNASPPVVSAQPGHGIGLGNTRARLRELYGDAGTVELRTLDELTAAAVVRLPYRTELATEEVA